MCHSTAASCNPTRQNQINRSKEVRARAFYSLLSEIYAALSSPASLSRLRDSSRHSLFSAPRELLPKSATISQAPSRHWKFQKLPSHLSAAIGNSRSFPQEWRRPRIRKTVSPTTSAFARRTSAVTEAMLASVRRKADELSAAIRSAKPKRGRPIGSRTQRGKRPNTPTRCSLRSAGLPPAYLLPEPYSTHLSSSLASSVLGSASPSPAEAKNRADDFDAGKELVLKPEHVRRVVNSSILSVRVLPLVDRTVVAAGDKMGNIGFWDVDAVSEDWYGDGAGHVFRYWPHKSPVAAIVAHQAAPQKIYSCSYQGEICLMDFEKENFNMIHLCESPVYSLCQAQNHVRCLYFGDGNGDLTLFDERVGKVSTTWDVHDEGINSIDFHPENTHMLATSSRDRTACIWDVRSMKTKGQIA
uniref:Uncharacterized protein n=1 Tax=Avena sativa TaxID=4498 RepID=A0ACD5Z665_AVESA